MGALGMVKDLTSICLSNVAGSLGVSGRSASWSELGKLSR